MSEPGSDQAPGHGLRPGYPEPLARLWVSDRAAQLHLTSEVGDELDRDGLGEALGLSVSAVASGANLDQR